jgi:hypothetical protein
VFSRNQPQKSADDYYIGNLKNKMDNRFLATGRRQVGRPVSFTMRLESNI